MKKIILVLVVCFGFALVSCKDKEHKHSEETHMHDEDGKKDTDVKETASNTLYQCPMNCEKGKSYIKEGNCPVCKMKLKAKEVDMDADKKVIENAEVESAPNS